MFVVVGLGNPGVKYDGTRHNVGFEAADHLVQRYGLTPFKPWKSSHLSRGTISGEDILVIKPQTFMNLSGDAVGAAVRYYRCEPANVLVIHDELDFEPGEMRLKSGGGHGGHNGLRSIMDHIGRDFTRIRVGIGKPPRGLGENYVLSRFDRTSRTLIDEVLEDIMDAVESIVTKGVRGAMNTVNGRPSSAKQGDSR